MSKNNMLVVSGQGSMKRKNMICRFSAITIVICSICVTVSGCAAIQVGEEPTVRKIKMSDLYSLRQQAVLAYQESRWIEALRLYQNIVEQIPTDANAWFSLGNTYAQQGVFERAIHAYEQSLKYDSEHAKSWFNLSTAYLLNAQTAMRGAYSRLRDGDPAKRLIAERLRFLDGLVHGRFEDGIAPLAYSVR